MTTVSPNPLTQPTPTDPPPSPPTSTYPTPSRPSAAARPLAAPVATGQAGAPAPPGSPTATYPPPARPSVRPLAPPAVLPEDGGAKVLRVGDATVRLRPVAPDDGAALVGALERMSLRTRWLRFHSPVARLSQAQLRMLLDVDHQHRDVLVAEVELGAARWRLIGFAQYARIGPDRADAAIVLEDAWQGRGIGKALALELVRAARRAGIAAFTSEILTENHRTLKFARALAPRHEGRLLGITTELTLWFDPA
jgi:RimJ/RimL family protein N-acetyltransferase